MVHIFIVNPYAGQKTFADGLRSKLEEIEGLNYFVFNTRYAGYEKVLVKKILHIFKDEKLRFYCCGGSGTMRNMLNGFENPEEAEIAFFPCGLTNDFLKMFGENQERFHHIEELIWGDVISVDYIRTNHGISLNTVSCGFDSEFVDRLERYRILTAFGSEVPYFSALFSALFISKTQEYEVYIDDKRYQDRYAEVFFGNGCTFGGNMHFAVQTSINDGEGIYLMAPPVKGAGTLPILKALVSENEEKLDGLTYRGVGKTMRIRRTDGKAFSMNFDGELEEPHAEWKLQMVKKGLRLVVPKGVKL